MMGTRTRFGAKVGGEGGGMGKGGHKGREGGGEGHGGRERKQSRICLNWKKVREGVNKGIE